MKKKTGRLSKEERSFIEENGKIMTAADIAQKLNRDIDPVSLYLKKIGLSNDKRKSFEVQAEYNLKEKPQWRELKQQFSEKELELFLHHWKSVIAQFKKDVLPTEEMQIIDMVKLEVLMNRALTEEYETLLLIEQYGEMVKEEEKKSEQDQDKALLMTLRRDIVSLRAAKQALNANYKELLKSKNTMFTALKATRAERIQKIENSKTTLAAMVFKLVNDPDFFEETGLYMERMRIAMEEEKKRLGDYHTYDDKTLDRPILNAETIGDEE